MERKEAINVLISDVLAENPYDVFNALGLKTSPDESKAKFVGYEENGSELEKYKGILDEFTDWLNAYKSLNKPERLSISDVAITNADKRYLHGTILVVNGMNGMTQVSRQSLKHIMDIMANLEDHYGARAFLTQVSSHSDVYYYVLSFVIWNDHVTKAKDNHEWGNLKPLYHV